MVLVVIKSFFFFLFYLIACTISIFRTFLISFILYSNTNKYFWSYCYTANKCILQPPQCNCIFVNIVIIILIVSDMRRKMKIPSFFWCIFEGWWPKKCHPCLLSTFSIYKSVWSGLSKLRVYNKKNWTCVFRWIVLGTFLELLESPRR